MMALCACPALAAPQTAVRPRRATVVVKAQATSRVVRVPTLKEIGQTAAGVSAALLLAASPAFAEIDLGVGADVFSNNCAACHAGGGNSVVPGKTLAKADLESYLDGGYNEAAIIKQVTYGKNAMPAWGDRLDEDEIESVAAYVFKTAVSGDW